MTSLPLEILRLAFKHLKPKELFQCQLTCKGWYEGSVELLYSKVIIFRKDSLLLYLRTISNSPSLGNYLKEINTGILLGSSQPRRARKHCDQYEWIDALIKHCPNLLVFGGKKVHPTFWSQISYAATQGQLTHLQVLPAYYDNDIESYLNTALLFKSTLTRLEVYHFDEFLRYGLNLSHLVPYQIFLNQSREFKNLQTLTISCRSDSQLCSFDSLIDNCPRLKELDIDLIPTEEERIEIEIGAIINPNLKIQNLYCSWQMVNNEIQMRYLIQKFTNLQYLEIAPIGRLYNSTIVHFPVHVAIDLLRFVLTIPNFRVRFPLRIPYLAKFWIELMHMNNTYRDVTIIYNDKSFLLEDEIEGERGIEIGEVELNIENMRSDMFYNCKYGIQAELFDGNFLPEVGNKIRSLTVSFDTEDPYQINWIFQILKSCPLLQELSVPTVMDANLSDNLKFQHMEVKKLTVTGDYEDPLKFLKFMSLYLPNIICIQLEHDSLRPLIIYMPNTSLDQLILINVYLTTRLRDNIGNYIRLNMDSGLSFFFNDNDSFCSISEEEYNKKPTGRFYMDITCRNLKEILLRCRKDTPREEGLTLIF